MEHNVRIFKGASYSVLGGAKIGAAVAVAVVVRTNTEVQQVQWFLHKVGVELNFQSNGLVRAWTKNGLGTHKRSLNLPKSWLFTDLPTKIVIKNKLTSKIA